MKIYCDRSIKSDTSIERQRVKLKKSAYQDIKKKQEKTL